MTITGSFITTMTSFGWKRKFSAKIPADSVAVFDDTEENSEGEEGNTDNVFLTLAKKRKTFILEDCVTKSERLIKEGITLAEAERYWEAIKKWDEAIQLTPGKSEIYEMKAQVQRELTAFSLLRGQQSVGSTACGLLLWHHSATSESGFCKYSAQMELSEVFPAVQSAERAVSLDPLWWAAYQTLARAQLGLGEVELAKKSISRAIHIHPVERELWEEDLRWIQSLSEQKKVMKQTTEQDNG